MQPEWTERFAWHRRGTGLFEFGPAAGVGVDWELVQTTAGLLFLLVRANNSTQLGAMDLEVLATFTAQATLSGYDTCGIAYRVDAEARTNPVHTARAEEEWVTFRARQAEAIAQKAVASKYSFTVTNLCLDAPPAATWEVDSVRLAVVPIECYEEVVSTLYTRDRYAITATLTIETGERTKAVEEADLFCELASYALGCRVQWLHLEGLSAEGQPMAAWLSSAITGPFVRLPLIDDAAFWTFVTDQRASYYAFRDEQPAHARRLLGILMNATSSDDFLELRGLKLASAVDALCTIMLPARRPQQFVSNGRRDYFLSAVRHAIREHATKTLLPDSPDDPGRQVRWAQQMANKVNDLLRPPFHDLIQELCGVLSIAVPADDVACFVRARNELVHEARFVSQRAAVPEDWPFTTPRQEYFWMLRFVDRLVLRTLGYRGAFLDRSTQDGASVAAECA
jgi:hypothetical protein